MSLNFSDTGKPVAKIKGGKYNGKRISLNPDSVLDVMQRLANHDENPNALRR